MNPILLFNPTLNDAIGFGLVMGITVGTLAICKLIGLHRCNKKCSENNHERRIDRDEKQ